MAIIPNECKFHVVSESVDTTDRGSKLAQSKRESITMADIIETAGGPFDYGSGGDTSIVSKNSSNTATQPYSSVIGGHDNNVLQAKGQILGGKSNNLDAAGENNTIIGGCYHTLNGGATGVDDYNNGGHIIAGGLYNSIYLNNTSNRAAHTISGGTCNYIIMDSTFNSENMYGGSTIVGGYYNCIDTEYGGAQGNSIFSGYYGKIKTNADTELYQGLNSIVAGCGGEIVDSEYSSMIGSRNGGIERGSNAAIIGSQFSYSTTVAGETNNGMFIVGGSSNNINASAAYSGMVGGVLNTIYGNISRGVIVGGYFNDMNVPTTDSSIVGGRNNVMTNNRSVIAGGQAVTTDRDNTLFCENLSIKNIPTSSAGLPSGAVWNNAGVLNIV